MSYSAAFSQAVEIVLYLSIKQKEDKLKYLSIQIISEKLEIPIPSVKRLVSLLKKEGILSSKTRIAGGLSIQKDVETITLFDIFQSIEGSKKPLFNFYDSFDLSQFENSSDVELYLNNFQEILTNAESAMLKELKSCTISDLLYKA